MKQSDNRKIAFHTLGCKLNFAESSSIAKQLFADGFTSALKSEKADVCIINTCSVTELADKKSRNLIRKIAHENPESYIIVTGCFAQLKPDEVSEIPDVDLIVGTAEKLNIPHILTAISHKEKTQRVYRSDFNEIKQFDPSCSQDGRTRVFLKIQDGCDYFCSYCTVPYARGRSRNGTIEEIYRQAEEAVTHGANEIILTGVNIGDFGKTTGETFFDLVKRLDTLAGTPRIRISSIEPNLLTDEIIAYVASSKCFMPHFHIPLQSGCDEVLKSMKRRYDTALFALRISSIKSLMPDAFIGVDVIVGFNGESREHFEQTQRFLASLPVSQLHVFPYSERGGTNALNIGGKVSKEEKQQRSKELLMLSKEKLVAFYQSQVGKKCHVLFEHGTIKKGVTGFTENYLKVSKRFAKELENTIQGVTLQRFCEENLCFEIE